MKTSPWLRYLKKAITVPPHILLRKIVLKAHGRYLYQKTKRKDLRKTTYALNKNFGSVRTFIDAKKAKQWQRNFPFKEPIDRENAHFLAHEFDLLGSGWVRVYPGMQCLGIENVKYPPQEQEGVSRTNQEESKRLKKWIQKEYQPIDWQIDFKSGYRWSEKTWSREIRYGSELGADVKVPWELSRMQHLSFLAWGFLQTSQDQYRIEFQNQIFDFLSSNPPRFGVNWVCTMDVGIRIANWLIAYDLFHAFGAELSEEFKKVFARAVYEHGFHIFHHLEWDPHLRSNHYLANIAGLLFAAAYLPETVETKRWLEFSIEELKKEVLLQFHPDGSNFEGSTSYHRLSTEMVLFATSLAMDLGTQFSEEYLLRTQKMADFIEDTTKPDGQIAQFGDNDSGRFIKMVPSLHFLDHRYLIEPIRQMKGLTEVIEAHLTPLSALPQRPRADYPGFGLYIQRNEMWVAAVRAGSIGQRGNGGHAHNDQLSFELAFQGISLIVDPGTYVYTPFPEMRRLFRSTQMHNTLALEGAEQNKDEGLFQMKDRARSKMLCIEPGVWKAEHTAYGSTYRRSLWMKEKSFEGLEEATFGPKLIPFHLAKGWSALIREETVFLEFENLKLALSGKGGKWELLKSFYSPSYGVKEESLSLLFRSQESKIFWKFVAL